MCIQVWEPLFQSSTAEYMRNSRWTGPSWLFDLNFSSFAPGTLGALYILLISSRSFFPVSFSLCSYPPSANSIPKAPIGAFLICSGPIYSSVLLLVTTGAEGLSSTPIPTLCHLNIHFGSLFSLYYRMSHLLSILPQLIPSINTQWCLAGECVHWKTPVDAYEVICTHLGVLSYSF